jgi:hypothetical protein
MRIFSKWIAACILGSTAISALAAQPSIPDILPSSWKLHFQQYYLLDPSITSNVTGKLLIPSSKMPVPGQSIYARITGQAPAAGTYIAFSALNPYYAGKDDEHPIGYGIMPIAELQWQENTSTELAKFTITQLNQELTNGAIVIPEASLSPYQSFSPYYPKNAICGQILAAVPKSDVVSLYQTIVLNIGSADGLHPGALLSIANPPTEMPDPEDEDKTISVPSEPFGLAVIYRETAHLSLALVVNAEHEFDTNNTVCNAK